VTRISTGTGGKEDTMLKTKEDVENRAIVLAQARAHEGAHSWEEYVLLMEAGIKYWLTFGVL